MPLGNGDITANVWVENGGDLMLYIGKSDTWSEGTRLLKLGRTRIHFSPNPFAAGQPFNQTLDFYHGKIDITAGQPASPVNVRLWIDANQPVIRIEATGAQAFTMTCSNEIWRSSAYKPNGSESAASSWRGVNTGWTETADAALSLSDRLVSYHRNASSQFQNILAGENLSGQWTNFADPYINRTFGMTIKGDDHFNKLNDRALQSTPRTNGTVSIYAYTAQTATLNDWQNQMSNVVAQVEAVDTETARTNHYGWWDSFWNRSWIFVSGDANATNVTRGYLEQRFMEACQGRGKYPMKFNGGTFTFDYNGQNADYRTWGPGYWNQNSRLLYWPLLASGDGDLLKPWFDCYTNMLPLQMAATSKYYGHGGAFFPETFNFFGLYLLTDWGGNPNGTITDNQYVRYHYQGGLEVLAMMLDYYDYTQDGAFATNYLVPFGTQVIRFFDQHWPRTNGKLFFYPANAIEMYWDCTNSTDYISGLMKGIPGMLALPTNFTTPALLNEWSNCLSALPPLATNTSGAYIKPAQTYGAAHNSENPECYCIFPYQIYGLGKSNFNVGLQTFLSRTVQNNKNCWSQDVIEEALVGLTSAAQSDVIGNFNQTDSQCRFQAFWTSHNDYLPDMDNGGAGMSGLQYMLMQCASNHILALPSWPSTWDVDFKLCAPSNTTVRVKFQNGAVNLLDVSPAFRTNDVTLPAPPTAPPSIPTGLAAAPGQSKVVLNWNVATDAATYNVKRATKTGGPYSLLALNVRNINYTDSAVTNGSTYFYVVSASNALGESPNSAEVSATPSITVALASADNPPNETAAMAFDGLTSTKWFNANSGNTGWLRYYFGAPKTVIGYSLGSANDVPGRDPKNWQFQGSHDGNTWTTLDTQSGQTFSNRFQIIQYPINNTAAYEFYRLNITANNGDSSGVQLSELQFVLGTNSVNTNLPPTGAGVVVDDDFNDYAHMTNTGNGTTTVFSNTNGIGNGFNVGTWSGGVVLESGSVILFRCPNNGADRNALSSIDALPTTLAGSVYEFRGVRFAKDPNSTTNSTGKTDRLYLGVADASDLNIAGGGWQQNPPTGFYVQFESDSLTGSAQGNSGFNGRSSLFYKDTSGNRTTLATWTFDTLNFRNALTVGTNAFNYTPTLNVKLTFNDTGWGLSITGDTRDGGQAINFTGNYLAAGINPLSAGHAVAFDQTENLGVDLSIDRILMNQSATFINVNFNGTNFILNWPSGTLLESTNLSGPWITNPVISPYTLTPTQSQKFFKAIVPF